MTKLIDSLTSRIDGLPLHLPPTPILPHPTTRLRLVPTPHLHLLPGQIGYPSRPFRLSPRSTRANQVLCLRPLASVRHRRIRLLRDTPRPPPPRSSSLIARRQLRALRHTRRRLQHHPIHLNPLPSLSQPKRRPGLHRSLQNQRIMSRRWATSDLTGLDGDLWIMSKASLVGERYRRWLT